MHDTVVKHRRDWATGEDHWYVECYTCDWVSPLQRTPALAHEREDEHCDQDAPLSDFTEDVTP